MAVESHMRESRPWTTISLDVAKQVFQVHRVDGVGTVVRRKLRRDDVIGYFKALPPCLIGVEACATGHHWARVLMALGHEVRLMPASYVKPYVKRQKNDATDAEAICEAATQPTMRFVPVKSEEKQSVLMLHRVRELLIRQRTMLVNALRGHLAEFGVVSRQGIAGVGTLIALVKDQDHEILPPLAQAALHPLIGQLPKVHEKVSEMDRQIHAWHHSSELSRRLEAFPGVGPITASAIAATIWPLRQEAMRPAYRRRDQACSAAPAWRTSVRWSRSSNASRQCFEIARCAARSHGSTASHAMPCVG